MSLGNFPISSHLPDELSGITDNGRVGWIASPVSRRLGASLRPRGSTAAAHRLGLSTTVSDQVQALENALDVRLFNRTTRKVSLTEIEHEYYERCVQIPQELDEVYRVASALKFRQCARRGRVLLAPDFFPSVGGVATLSLVAAATGEVDIRWPFYRGAT
jgi:DNA-binding transcriptional LysR family regulator